MSKRQKDAERKSRSRDESERTEPGQDVDEIRTDSDTTGQERDSDVSKPPPETLAREGRFPLQAVRPDTPTADESTSGGKMNWERWA
jgi:hypothetical protein